MAISKSCNQPADSTPQNLKNNNPDMNIDDEYLAAYYRAMNAILAIQNAIHDMPAPESEGVTWGSVADMQRIATDLETITTYTR